MADDKSTSLRRLALNVCARSLVFSGRASRAEFAGFLIYAVALDAVFNLAFRLILDGEPESWARLAVDTLLFLPIYALLVRRLHDLDRSGWWSLIPAFVILRISGLKTLALSGYPDARDWIESTFEPLNWILVPGFLIVVMAAAFAPGRKAEKETADAGISAPAT